jgi:hypothetical protein
VEFINNLNKENQKMLKRFVQVTVLALVLGVAPMVALHGVSYATAPISWTGNGVTNGQFDTTQCEGDTPNSGDVLWVFTAAGADSATITINGVTSNMTQEGNGAFHFTQTGFNGDFDSLTASATYSGEISGNGTPKLVISHGCPGETSHETDVCVNIDGIQTEVPAGMVADENDNCTTPNTGGQGGGQVLGSSTTASVSVTPQGGVAAGAGGALNFGSL